MRSLIGNHVLANVLFVLVIVIGVVTYNSMPRARDPELNFSWVVIMTTLPGASSIEIEKRITDPLEDAISRTVKNTRFVSSTSRDNMSAILVRYNELSEREFDKHVADLRREVQNVYTDQLPEEARDPIIQEITTSSGFPTATVAVSTESPTDDFRRAVVSVQKQLERLPGIDEAQLVGIEDPELHISFYPDRLVGLGISPADLANTVRTYFQDISIGDLDTSQTRWLIRLEGTSSSIEQIKRFPVIGSRGIVELGQLAEVYRSTAEPSMLVRLHGKPAVMINIKKQEDANILELLGHVSDYIEQQNELAAPLGYQLALVDDQTIPTRNALSVMQQNAAIGLFLVVLVTYLFLGARIALLTSIGIPFTLAATFFVLDLSGVTLNNMTLLGIVISLGMIVDDAVVVVETIYYRLQRGAQSMEACIGALREVSAPVFTSVLTTVSVFFPLTLLTGIMGDYMRVVPLVVCIALLLSLLEAFWILPVHVTSLKVSFSRESRIQRIRRRFTQQLRHQYSLVLIQVFRSPWLALGGILSTAVLAIAILLSGIIPFQFFAVDPFRMIYVNANLPVDMRLQDTDQTLVQLEKTALSALEPGELRESIIYSGEQFNETESLHGENIGQVLISLNPRSRGMRQTQETIAAVEQQVGTQLGNAKISVFAPENGPPVGAPINIKVLGTEFEEIELAIEDLIRWMNDSQRFKNINTDFKAGSPELQLSLNGDAIQRAGLNPDVVTTALQAYVDGTLVTQYQHLGEEVRVRLKASQPVTDSVDTVLQQSIADANNNAITLGELVEEKYGYGQQNIRHYDFKRAITLRADIADETLNTVSANNLVMDYWESIQPLHPTIGLDFSGELDDIQESLDGMNRLFILGLGLIYLILGTQFKSYSQPLLVLVSVPLAFIGVVFGLALTRNPMSLMTMYGVVALSGIAVNSAIVLIAAANSRIAGGMSVLHATIFAARRRVVPILITSLTTVAGLFSLAAGVGGKSLVWGPLAAAIVSGLVFSTALILIVMPLLYYATESFKARIRDNSGVESGRDSNRECEEPL